MSLNRIEQQQKNCFVFRKMYWFKFSISEMLHNCFEFVNKTNFEKRTHHHHPAFIFAK